MKAYKTYQDIPQDEFIETVLKIARENISHTLSLPGIYEIISEEYNNDVLDLLCPYPED